MSETKIYEIKDIRANKTFSIMIGANNADAIRTFEDGIKNEKTFLNSHPEDFELIYVGDIIHEENEEYIIRDIFNIKMIKLMSGAEVDKSKKLPTADEINPILRPNVTQKAIDLKNAVGAK